MPYRYLPEIAIADVAFEAWGETLEELLRAAADATMNVMVGDLATIAGRVSRSIRIADQDLEMLLFQLLQELIFYKDAERLLLRIHSLELGRTEAGYEVEAEARGEELDPARHDLVVDVKAVTLHRFRVERTGRGWQASVVLDI
jgi:SHS2 domain-containing protein